MKYESSETLMKKDWSRDRSLDQIQRLEMLRMIKESPLKSLEPYYKEKQQSKKDLHDNNNNLISVIKSNENLRSVACQVMPSVEEDEDFNIL